MFVARLRRMGSKHLLDSPSIWKRALIPKFYSVVVHPHLYLCSAIVLVNDGIEYRFSQSRFWYFQRLESPEPLIVNGSSEIFRPQHFDDLVCHADDISLDNILENQITLIFDKASYAEIA